MRRVVFICAVLAVLSPTYAEAAERIWRMGVLALADDGAVRSIIMPHLATRGFVEGRNLVVNVRIGVEEQMPELARTLVGDKPDVIIAISDWALHALRAATSTIPIVVAPMGGDPVRVGVAESWAHRVSEIALLLRLCGDEGVSTLLRVLRRLFIVDEVMPEIVDWLFRGHVEDMGSAGIDDDLEIGFTGDRLTVRSWCPVVFLANQDESANRWVDAVVAERIVGDDPCDPAVPARSILCIGRLQRRNGAVREADEEDMLRIDLGHRLEYGHGRQSIIAAARKVLHGFFSIQIGANALRFVTRSEGIHDQDSHALGEHVVDVGL